MREIWWSANSDSAITYRQRVGLFTRPSVGVVVQTLLNPAVAGVMFTENPVTGADERLIEASWGLGEAVVAGLVIPDHFRLDRSGQVLERKPGRKRIAIRSLPNGGTFEEQVAPAQVSQLCLDDAQLAAAERARAAVRAGLRPAARHRMGDRRTGRSTCSSAAPSPPARRAARRPAGPPPRDPWPRCGASRSSPTWTDGRPSRSRACSRSAASPQGETVVKEGAGGAAFFLIESGEADGVRAGAKPPTLGPGDYFGEIALIDEGARSATVTAATDLVCYGLTFWEFRPLVERERRDRLEAAAGAGEEAARGGTRPALSAWAAATASRR